MIKSITVLARTCFIYFVLVLFGGCAVQQTMTDENKLMGWKLHQDKLAELDQWTLKGRIAIRLEKEGWTATLHWRQQQGRYSLRLIAPLGRGTFELIGDNQSVSLRTADNRLLYADDAETLLQQNLGWRVPVSGLFYWIRGLPEPGTITDNLLLDDSGRASAISQGGWQVRYTDYMTSESYNLPRKLTMQHDKLIIRLIIQDWDFPLS